MNLMKPPLTLAGALAAALAASACCIGPLAFVLLGIGGVGFALALEPYRPYFLALTAILLGTAFYFAYRRTGPACRPAEGCGTSGARRAGRILLWIVTILVILVTAFPYYSRYLF